MAPDPLSADASAVEIACAVNARCVSPREVVEAAIDRVRRADEAFNFLVADRFQEALDDAGRVDLLAPLAGVPILIKDFLATCAGMPQSDGSSFARGWAAPHDSEYVSRLKRGGAIVLGVASTSEFALLSTCEPRRYGPTLNPCAPQSTTGGSSGAAAAAVAARAVPAAHGSDAGGSIRIPASCCGLVGLKPTRAWNPLGPEHGDLGVGIWTEHVLTRSARDSAAFLRATAGPQRGDPYAPPRWGRRSCRLPLRVCWTATAPTGQPSHPECAAAVANVVAALSDLGHDVREGAPAFDAERAEQDFFAVFCASAAARLNTWMDRLGRAPNRGEIEAYSWDIIERGRALSAVELLGAIDRLQRDTRQISEFYADCDIWATPTLTHPPVPLGYFAIAPGETAEDVLSRDAELTPFLWIANVTGQPALSYPASVSHDGRPIGVQLSASAGADAILLDLAAALELPDLHDDCA